jgi:hypothetical protein
MKLHCSSLVMHTYGWCNTMNLIKLMCWPSVRKRGQNLVFEPQVIWMIIDYGCIELVETKSIDHPPKPTCTQPCSEYKGRVGCSEGTK